MAMLSRLGLFGILLSSVFGLPSASDDVGDPLVLATTMPASTVLPGATAVVSPPGLVKSRDDCAPMPIYASTGGIPAPPHFEIGDKIKLLLYEVVKDTEATNSGDPNFQQRPEFSGEFTVQDDGTLAVPMVGLFQVANKTQQYLQAALAAAFEKLTGHKGFVTVMAVERPPIYVMGPVKTPGSYKYSMGMTVLHAVALAGGFSKTGGDEPWQKIEAVRATIGFQNTLETMTEALARVAVLKAERDKVAVQIPAKLVQLLGDIGAQRLIAIATEQRAAIVSTHQTQLQMIQASITTAQQEVAMMDRHAHPFADLVKSRGDRATAMQQLQQQGVVNRNYLIQAQGELADTEQREQDSINQLMLAQQRVAQLQQDLEKTQAQMRIDLDNMILAGEKEIATQERETLVNSGVLGVLNVDVPSSVANFGKDIQQIAAPGASAQQQPRPTGVAYEIIRQTSTGPRMLAAHDITTVEPGDLVRIVTPTDLDGNRASPVSTEPVLKGCTVGPTQINLQQ
jgi:exopolysaccharide production protein ExoF